MWVYGPADESLPYQIECDATANLPLLAQQQSMLRHVMAYTAIPYSIPHAGSADKTAIILNQLRQLGVPLHALGRALVVEPDPALFSESRTASDSGLSVANPLAQRLNMDDSRLQAFLEHYCPKVECRDNTLHVDDVIISDTERVELTAQCHEMALVYCWDEQRQCVEPRVLDPSLSTDRLCSFHEVRSALNSQQAWLLTAPVTLPLRLDNAALTEQQRTLLTEQVGMDEDALGRLDDTEHSHLMRRLIRASNAITDDALCGSSEGILPSSASPAQLRRHLSGLIESRQQRLPEASDYLNALHQALNDPQWSQLWSERAKKAEGRLSHLADVTAHLVYFSSLAYWQRSVSTPEQALALLTQPDQLESLRGLGVRLRRRIDQLATVSRAEDGRIDARAMTAGFAAATITTIQQMNDAGLQVFVDQVGNLHGLRLEQTKARAWQKESSKLASWCRQAMVMGSHIDTVNDAGKFDGRLGVLSGVDTLNTLHDLARFFSVTVPDNERGLLVTAYMGEEMTFTGQDVSMPGSSAIARQASVEAVLKMTNAEGEVLKDQLLVLLETLQEAQRQGEIELVNDLNGSDDLIAACPHPSLFYSPHSYERHIEQGPVLDRAGVPMALVNTIMGIYQEDYTLRGADAEMAALELTYRLRQVSAQPETHDARLTVGKILSSDDASASEQVAGALRWSIEGELNHAGATPTADRSDPAVAAGRLASYLRQWWQDCDVNEEHKAHIRPVVGHVKLLPGTNRNVIPGQVHLTTALMGDKTVSPRELLTSEQRADLQHCLRGYVAGTLSRPVKYGGEGIRLCRVEPVSYVNCAQQSTVSLDMRTPSSDVARQCLTAIDRAVDDIRGQFDVEIERRVEQKLDESHLSDSGQVLLVERSYGGSHNPNESELLSDILRGSVLQLVMAWQFAERSADERINLYEQVARAMPKSWVERQSGYTSGALHDTCNNSAGANAT